MIKKHIINLHGFGSAGGLKNEKAIYFNQHFQSFAEIAFHSIDFTPTPKDFEFHTITGMIARLRQYIFDFNLSPISLIGSSQGAIVALNYAHRFKSVEKLLLLAPQLSYITQESEQELQEWKEAGQGTFFHYGFEKEVAIGFGHHEDGLRYSNAPPPPAPIKIIHGLNDQIIPINLSRLYADRYPASVHLIEVDDNHRLSSSSELILQEATSLFNG